MLFWEAMREMQENGKKIRCTYWPHKYYESIIGRCLPNSCSSLEGYAESEWELYEEPQRTYSWMQVVEGLKKGKKFRRLSWLEDRLILCPYPLSQIWFECVKGVLLRNNLSIADYQSTDWVEVE